MENATLQSLSKEELIENVLRIKKESSSKDNRLAELEFQLAQLKRLIFGAKSERFVPKETPSNQLELDLGQAVEIANQEAKTETITYTRDKKTRTEKPVRQQIPDSFPRNVIEIEPEQDTTGMKYIGHDVTEELEYTPPKLVVNKYCIKKYAKEIEGGTQIISGKRPSRPIEKGIPGPGLLSRVIIDKYVDHLPLYRQSQRFAREGIKIPLSTMSDWVARCCELLDPLYEKLKQKVLESGYVQADETPIKVLDDTKKGSTHQGYHWVYHSPVEKLVLFDYRPGRSRSGPIHMLRNYKGWLQTDGYVAYNEFEKRQEIFLVGCLAHVRRYFEKALEYDQDNASLILNQIKILYAIEREAREGNLSFDQRKDLRQEKALTIINELSQWIQEHHNTFLPKSPMGEAVNYFLGRFNYITRYLQDGQLEIDNNLAENSIRPIALGRKNYLFAGSHEGAKRAALLYSLLGTCKKKKIEPFSWLRDTLAKISDHPINRIEELLP